jgi:prevent-host-death family protein
MSAQSISVMDFRKRIGDILSRVHYTGEQFVIERNGEPVAAIIAIDDLKRLQTLDENIEPLRERWHKSLAEAQALRESIAERQGGLVTDSAEDVRDMRESRANDLNSLR